MWSNMLLAVNGPCRKSTVVYSKSNSTDSTTYTGEEQSPQRSVDDVQDLVTDKDAEDGEEEEHNEAHKQHPPAGSEVILALEEVEREGRSGRSPEM